ncbi:GNAT family N-acetyltransferase [Thiolapillus sp.]
MFRLVIDEELHLVFLEEALAAPVFELIDANREYLGRWLPWVPDTRSVADVQMFIQRSITGFSNMSGLVCAIEYRGEIVGIISYNKISRKLKKVEIGYWLAENRQGQGIMTRCCHRLIDHAFVSMDMEKVEIRVAVDNQPSRRLCERLGMTLEGIISNAERLSQGIVAHAIYGLHRSGGDST